MAKLHELLAVEGPRKTQVEKVRTDMIKAFEKRHLYSEKTVTFESSVDGIPSAREEQLDLQTTIPRELSLISKMWAKALDVAYQVAETNTKARANVILDDGTVLLEDVPVTALLELEKRAEEIRELVAQIPTLDPAKGFRPDPNKGPDVYQAREHRATRTKKVPQALVLYEATAVHPAQVKEINPDVPIGTVQTQEWSGLITPSDKSAMLERAEDVKRAIKEARSRANDTDVDPVKHIGITILNYVFVAPKAT